MIRCALPRNRPSRWPRPRRKPNLGPSTIRQARHVRESTDDVCRRAAGWPSRDEGILIKEYHIGAARIYRQKPDPAVCHCYVNQLREWASATRLGLPLMVAIDAEASVDVVKEGVSKFLPAAGITTRNSWR